MSCREFNCLWLYGLVGGEACRPDKLGVVFLLTKDQERLQAMEVWPTAAASGSVGGRVIDHFRERISVIVVRATGPRTLLTVKGQHVPERIG
jgi:uncharacterized protein (DUF2126 family)